MHRCPPPTLPRSLSLCRSLVTFVPFRNTQNCKLHSKHRSVPAIPFVPLGARRRNVCSAHNAAVAWSSRQRQQQAAVAFHTQFVLARSSQSVVSAAGTACCIVCITPTRIQAQTQTQTDINIACDPHLFDICDASLGRSSGTSHLG